MLLYEKIKNANLDAIVKEVYGICDNHTNEELFRSLQSQFEDLIKNNKFREFLSVLSKNIKLFEKELSDNSKRLLARFNQQQLKKKNEAQKLNDYPKADFLNKALREFSADKNVSGFFQNKLAYFNCVYVENSSDKNCYFICSDKSLKVNGGVMNKNSFLKMIKPFNQSENTVKGKSQQALQRQNASIDIDKFNEYFNSLVNSRVNSVKTTVEDKNGKDIEVTLGSLLENNNVYYSITWYDKSKNFSGVNDGIVIPCMANMQSIEGTIAQTLANFEKNYANHPYRDQVIQSVEDNMKGNKYISIGNNAYKESIEFYKAAVKRILENKEALKEDTNDITSVTDGQLKSGVNLVEQIYGTAKNLKWADEDFKNTIEAARSGDNSAVGYIMYKHAPMIVSTFWKNYLGPNKKMRALRIADDGGLKSSLLGWIGICLRALIKGGVDITKKNGKERHKFSTLEGFKISKVTGNVENQFAAHFRLDVIEQAKVYNVMHARNGISGADGNDNTKITMTNLEFDNGRERADGEDDIFTRDDLEDSVINKISNDDFLKNWINYCQDEDLLDGKKCSPSKALWALLSNPNATNLKSVAEECGVARMTFETLVKKAISLLSQYNIEYKDLMNACDRYGAKKIASYLAH